MSKYTLKFKVRMNIKVLSVFNLKIFFKIRKRNLKKVKRILLRIDMKIGVKKLV